MARIQIHLAHFCTIVVIHWILFSFIDFCFHFELIVAEKHCSFAFFHSFFVAVNSDWALLFSDRLSPVCACVTCILCQSLGWHCCLLLLYCMVNLLLCMDRIRAQRRKNWIETASHTRTHTEKANAIETGIMMQSETWRSMRYISIDCLCCSANRRNSFCHLLCRINFHSPISIDWNEFNSIVFRFKFNRNAFSANWVRSRCIHIFHFRQRKHYSLRSFAQSVTHYSRILEHRVFYIHRSHQCSSRDELDPKEHYY